MTTEQDYYDIVKDEKILKEMIRVFRAEGRKEALEEVFAKFDKYSCIKNDKWYLEFKEAKIKELEGKK